MLILYYYILYFLVWFCKLYEFCIVCRIILSSDYPNYWSSIRAKSLLLVLNFYICICIWNFGKHFFFVFSVGGNWPSSSDAGIGLLVTGCRLTYHHLTWNNWSPAAAHSRRRREVWGTWNSLLDVLIEAQVRVAVCLINIVTMNSKSSCNELEHENSRNELITISSSNSSN